MTRPNRTDIYRFLDSAVPPEARSQRLKPVVTERAACALRRQFPNIDEFESLAFVRQWRQSKRKRDLKKQS